MYGSFREEDGTAAARMILQIHDSSVIFAAYRYLFNYNNAPEAKVHAIMISLVLARQHTELLVIVQFDSSTALSCIFDSSLDR